MIYLSFLYLGYLLATKVMTDMAMTTNSLDLFWFFKLYGDTSRKNYEIVIVHTQNLTLNVFSNSYYLTDRVMTPLGLEPLIFRSQVLNSYFVTALQSSMQQRVKIY